MSKTNAGLVTYAIAQLGQTILVGHLRADGKYGMTTKANATMRLI